jgi:hypothetical protein
MAWGRMLTAGRAIVAHGCPDLAPPPRPRPSPIIARVIGGALRSWRRFGPRATAQHCPARWFQLGREDGRNRGMRYTNAGLSLLATIVMVVACGGGSKTTAVLDAAITPGIGGTPSMGTGGMATASGTGGMATSSDGGTPATGGVVGAGGATAAGDALDATTTTETTQPTPGDWIGTTSQGATISFTVGTGTVGRYYVAYDGNGCSGALGLLTLAGGTDTPITSGAFSQATTLSSGSPLGTYTIIGTFSSPTAASGTFTFDLIALGTSGCGGKGTVTWTAMPKVGDAGIPCRLSNCMGTTSFSFTYSCGTASSTQKSATSSGSSGVQATLVVTYTNGHVVQCENVSGDGGDRSQRCYDDTGATCSLVNPDAGSTPACPSDIATGLACSIMGSSCLLPSDAAISTRCYCTGQASTWNCPTLRS